jgi:dihydrofolate reductase
MGKLVCDISVSLDGFVAGPNATLEEPLGRDGERLHDWIVGLAAWRKRHGLEGGEENGDAEVVDEAQRVTGAFLMGRKMFSGGSGPWEDDPNANGWWGDDPPFRVPVFVLTHHEREPETKQGGTSYTFVTDGLESALEQARAVAGDEDVYIAGGASIVQQALRAGLLDELQLHVAPLLLGDGTRLLDNLGPESVQLEATRVIESPKVTHLRYRVVK